MQTAEAISQTKLIAFWRDLMRQIAWRAVAIIAADIVALAASYAAAALITTTLSPHHANDTFWSVAAAGLQYRGPQSAGFGFLLILWLYSKGHYSLRLPFWIESWHVVCCTAFALLCDGFVQYAMKHDFSRYWVLATWTTAPVLILLARRIARLVLRRIGLWEIPALIVGPPHRVEEVAALLHGEQGLGLAVAAVTPLPAINSRYGGSWLSACHDRQAQMVVLAVEDSDMQQERRLISRLAIERVPFTCVRNLGGLPAFSMEVHHFVGREVLLLAGQSRLLQPFGRLVKSLFDYGVAALLLVLTGPFLLILGPLIARDGGPVFFTHDRLGADGRIFRCLKFRTMTPDAPERLAALLAADASARQEWEETHKLQSDPRITPVGRFLRTYSLDELPQLLNVLKGEMSLVGPRPISPAETGRFGRDLEFYLQVRPGMTGLWQVSGRNGLDYDRRVALNSWYVKNWSLWLDVIILLKTIPAVVSRRGAY